jgi:hypothetical protein
MKSKHARALLKPVTAKSDMWARIDAIFRMKGEFDRGPQSRTRERSSEIIKFFVHVCQQI